LRPRLHTLMTPWVNEGFFADVVVLVEGEDDRAAILGNAVALGHDFESMGISVIPCDGKSRMDRPIAIFQALQIPCYAIWDSDVDKKGTDKEKESSGQNKRLLRLMGAEVEDFPNRMEQHFGCFEIKLEQTIEAEIGAIQYAKLLQTAQKKFGYSDKRSAIKSPLVIAKTITDARQIGLQTKSLEQLVEKILHLKRTPQEKQLRSDSLERATPISVEVPRNTIGQGSLPLD
jgi:putative ATP-dependent endonuclease of the OLD family